MSESMRGGRRHGSVPAVRVAGMGDPIRSIHAVHRTAVKRTSTGGSAVPGLTGAHRKDLR
jgi:hypothetical protein